MKVWRNNCDKLRIRINTSFDFAQSVIQTYFMPKGITTVQQWVYNYNHRAIVHHMHGYFIVLMLRTNRIIFFVFWSFRENLWHCWCLRLWLGACIAKFACHSNSRALICSQPVIVLCIQAHLESNSNEPLHLHFCNILHLVTMINDLTNFILSPDLSNLMMSSWVCIYFMFIVS